jgi:hypothetical protein
MKTLYQMSSMNQGQAAIFNASSSFTLPTSSNSAANAPNRLQSGKSRSTAPVVPTTQSTLQATSQSLPSMIGSTSIREDLWKALQQQTDRTSSPQKDNISLNQTDVDILDSSQCPFECLELEAGSSSAATFQRMVDGVTSDYAIDGTGGLSERSLVRRKNLNYFNSSFEAAVQQIVAEAVAEIKSLV